MGHNPVLEFLGAAGTVTGSKTMFRFRKKNVLVDCGLFQGDKTLRQRNWESFAFGGIDKVLLTHAHLDHSGYLPRLYKLGYRGPVYCSPGTADLCRILLLDAAYLEEEFASYANATGYSNHKPALPLFTTKDAEGALKLLEPRERDEWFALDENVQARFLRAGHIIGASMLEIGVSMGQRTKRITFSGDLGHARSDILKPPADLLETDVLVLESTYGNRLHDRADRDGAFAAIIQRVTKRGGVLVIPAFAVGRAQEILYLIRKLEDTGAIRPIPVILDSPMASSATSIFLRHPEDHLLDFGEDCGSSALCPKLFEIATTPDESMLACMRDGPMIVISAAGMLNGGRILHHLKHRLPHAENAVLFAGYQAEGSKGRFLQDNAGKVATLRIHHQEVPIEAEVVTLGGLSAHADYRDIMEWLARIKRFPDTVYLNHGSPDALEALGNRIKEAFRCNVVPVVQGIPYQLLWF